MKKIMVMLVAAVAAVAANAATCQWTSGTLKTATSTEGGWGATTLNSALVTMNVYFVDADTYSSLGSATAQSLYDTYSVATASLTGTNANGVDSNGNPKYKGAITITDNNGQAADMYAVVIATYSDQAYGDMYIATTAKSVWNEGTQKGVAGNLISTAGTSTGWQAVPEPTSGLLLLLGVAGLALRRKQA